MEENCFIRKNTPEHKDLLLKDLCSRLPYGVNVEYTFKVTVIATNIEEIITKPLYLYSINTLDDMTVSGIDNDGYEIEYTKDTDLDIRFGCVAFGINIKD